MTVIECRQKAVGDDILRCQPIAHDQVGDGLHVAAVPGEQVGQHLGASPTECFNRHPILPVDPPPWWRAGGSCATG
jgi:hypothetical protein